MNRIITVKGVGKAKAQPDWVQLSLMLKSNDMEYEKAANAAATQLEELRNAIAGVGFAKSDLKTTDFGIQPEYAGEHDERGNYSRKFTGYTCTHALKLAFDLDTGRLGRVFAALSGCMAEPEFSVRFTVKDQEALKAALLADAAKNARARAEVLCAASGATLGELVSIEYDFEDQSIYAPVRYEMAYARSTDVQAAKIDVQPDDVELSDSVRFVWAIP